jgi:serine/threonine protein phosphatase 1
MNTTYVIGDIHGALKALVQVLNKVQPTNEDTFIFLGDYVDGWSESAQVIDYLIEFNKQHKCVFIKGNHDVWTMDWLQGKSIDPIWLKHGGMETIDSYKDLSDERKTQHLYFCQNMQNYFIDDQNRLFIHAGFSSMNGPVSEFYMSNYTWDRTLWEMALTMDKRIKKDSVLYPNRLKLYHEIYIGHTPTINYNVGIPMQGCNVWNIDTGAAFTGKLSIMNIDTKQFYQSDIVKELYPNEVGRNKK